MNKKYIYILFSFFLIVISCSEKDLDQVEDTGAVRFRAGIEKSEAAGLRSTEGLVDGEKYYLHYTPVATPDNEETGMNTHTYTYDGAKFSSDPELFWDDIKQEVPTKFYLTNMEFMEFPDLVSGLDILYAEATGWNKELDFELKHLLAQVTVVLNDKTLENNVKFDNAKVVFKPGFIRKSTGIDYAAAIPAIIASEDEREKQTVIDTKEIKEIENNNKKLRYATLPKDGEYVYVVPQTFNEDDSLEITAGDYVYRIPVPLKDDSPITLQAGERLEITINLTEDKMVGTATIVGWEPKSSSDIEVSRVFKIGSWPELKDLMQAINTGYTFKGMVVQLTQDIKLEGQISLGTEKYPFEGIFDGNGKTISNLGYMDESNIIIKNKGGLFGYTHGATLQNLIIESPYVESDNDNPVGAMVNRAENTTIFNCRTTSQEDKDGVVKGTGKYVGGLVGIATGESTIINSYTTIVVEGGTEYIGGLIGYSEANITHCSAIGRILSPSAMYVGGLAGYMTSSMLNCFAQGEVEGGSQVGGLIGYLDGKTEYCYASGTVICGDNANKGGLFGNLGFDGVAIRCFWKNAGGIKGAGSATLDGSCKAFSSGAELLGDDFLNNNATDIWNQTLVNGLPAFKNQ